MWEDKSSNNEDNNCIMQKLRIFSIAYSFMKNFFGFHLPLSEEIDFFIIPLLKLKQKSTPSGFIYKQILKKTLL
jgi:hypothetical protein